MKGLPFVGEDGFYPDWAPRDGRWLFQRTLATLGGMMAGYAEMVAARTPGADQVVVWVPRSGVLQWLPVWIAKSEPSHLELAYLGQQLWPDMQTMMKDLRAGIYER